MLTAILAYLWRKTVQHVAFPAWMSCVMIGWLRGLVGKMKDKDNELLPSLIEACGTYRTVKPFFYSHNINKCDEYNILNLKLVLFRLKHSASTEQLSVTDFYERSDFTAAIDVTFSCLLFVWSLVENL
jgi:hypothetical protein